jgi:hypothetical protein
MTILNKSSQQKAPRKPSRKIAEQKRWQVQLQISKAQRPSKSDHPADVATMLARIVVCCSTTLASIVATSAMVLFAKI